MIYFRVPFICKFKPGIPYISLPSDNVEQEDEEDYNVDPDKVSEGDEMYSLKVQLVADDETRSNLLETRTDSAMVNSRYY